MNVSMVEATKTGKQVQAEIVQLENRAESLKADNERLSKARDALQAEIDKKTSDYQIYISQRDAETKRIRQETLAQAADLAKQKEEFQLILQSFQTQKVTLEDQMRGFSVDKAKVQAKMDGIQNFIQAVQRALSVLGL